MSLHHRSTFFASPFFCSPLLAILSVDMPPVLSPSLALTGPSVLARPSSLSFMPRVCGISCAHQPWLQHPRRHYMTHLHPPSVQHPHVHHATTTTRHDMAMMRWRQHG